MHNAISWFKSAFFVQSLRAPDLVQMFAQLGARQFLLCQQCLPKLQNQLAMGGNDGAGFGVGGVKDVVQLLA